LTEGEELFRIERRLQGGWLVFVKVLT